MTYPAGAYIAHTDGYWWSGPTRGSQWLTGLDKAGFTLVLDEQFSTGTLDTSRWHPYDDSVDGHFGGSTRIQQYKYANTYVGAASSGATGAYSLHLVTNQTDNGTGTLPSTTSAGTRYIYTAGMVDTRSNGVTWPKYGYYEFRAKIPHGQGLWPSFWLTCDVAHGGATMAEYDIVEYFHSQLPGKNSSTIHGTDNTGTFHQNRYTNNGAAGNGVGGRTFFESPTYTPGWHTWGAEIVPVTDATGNTLADPKQPSSYVRLTIYLDGVQVWRVVDTSALYYTTNGGTEDHFWNIFLQGCQVDGNYVGHPQDALGYSHWLNTCLISGSPPGSCSIATGGYSVQRAHFDGVANMTEIDYVRIWKFTG